MKASLICRSTVKTGLRLVIGSWNITEIALPRIVYNSLVESVVSSSPLKVMLPSAMYPLPSSSLRMLMAETDLPQPLSPTTPRVLPGSTA